MRIAAIDRELVRCRLELDRQWLGKLGDGDLQPRGAPPPHVDNLASAHGMAEWLKARISDFAPGNGVTKFQWRDAPEAGYYESWALDLYVSETLSEECVASVKVTASGCDVRLKVPGLDFIGDGGGWLELEIIGGAITPVVYQLKYIPYVSDRAFETEHGMSQNSDPNGVVHCVNSFFTDRWVGFQKFFQVVEDLKPSILTAATACFTPVQFNWTWNGVRYNGGIDIRWTLNGRQPGGQVISAELEVSSYPSYCYVGLALKMGGDERRYASAQWQTPAFTDSALFAIARTETAHPAPADIIDFRGIADLTRRFSIFVGTDSNWRI